MPRSALLDTNVLHPMALCDLLVRLALEDLYRPLWSREILDETARKLMRRLKNVGVERLKRRVRLMEEALPVPSSSRGLRRAPSEGKRPLGKDAHVLAAAVAGGAEVIVTSNIRDFPRRLLQPFHVEAVSPDGFLVAIWRDSAASVARVLVAQAEGTKRPPLSRGRSRLRCTLALCGPRGLWASALHRRAGGPGSCHGL